MRALLAFAMGLVVGCSASSVTHGGGGAGGSGGTGVGGNAGGGGSAGIGGGGGGGGSGGDNCSDAAKLVYVIDENRTFSSFQPNQTDVTQSVFHDIAKLDCPSQLNGTPFSMSVDRSGTAWVEYVAVNPVLGTFVGAELFTVSTSDAHCTITSYQPQKGMQEVGMGFVSDAAGSDHETLFVSGGAAPDAFGQYAGTNLGTLDTATLTVTKGAAVQGRPELTGTGLATLWAFFPDATGTSMPRIAQLDKATASESHSILLSKLAGMPHAWAYAFWGGDNWVFLRRTAEASTTVYRVRPDGSMTSWTTSNRTIVGAGVSTCAPTVPIS
jgi:hypothetical protein